MKGNSRTHPHLATCTVAEVAPYILSTLRDGDKTYLQMKEFVPFHSQSIYNGLYSLMDTGHIKRLDNGAWQLVVLPEKTQRTFTLEEVEKIATDAVKLALTALKEKKL